MASAGFVLSFGVKYEIKRAKADIPAGTTDHPLIAGVLEKKIHIVSVVVLVGATATNVTFNRKPAGAGVAISPVFQFGANGGMVSPHNDHGYFDSTNDGEGISVTTGAGSQVGVIVNYIERN